MHPASKLTLKATFIQVFLQINIFLITDFHNKLIVHLRQICPVVTRWRFGSCSVYPNLNQYIPKIEIIS